jgi:hypothetical protein
MSMDRYADAPERRIPVIEVPADEGFATLDLADGQEPPVLNAVAVLSLPCPGQRIRGGVGGQAMTPCSFCGEVMASTAGPHSRDGRMVKPVVIDWLGEGDLIGWRPFLLALAVAP